MNRLLGVLLALALTVTLCACGKKSGTSWQEQYDLGVRYLSEGNYEEAVIAFTAAIEIDPKRPEAFLGRGSAYIGAGETADIQLAFDVAERRGESFLPLYDETFPMPHLTLPPEIEARLPEQANRGQLLSVLWETGVLRPGQVSVQLKSAADPAEPA